MEKRVGFGEMPPCSSASLCWSAAGFLPEPLKTHPELSGQETSANSLFILNVSAPFSGFFSVVPPGASVYNPLLVAVTLWLLLSVITSQL